MFYKDNNDIDVIQFGTGDVLVFNVKFPDKREVYGIGFCGVKNNEIGKDFPEYIGKKDIDVDTKLKILFTNTKSVDVVIEKLIQVKKDLINEEPK